MTALGTRDDPSVAAARIVAYLNTPPATPVLEPAGIGVAGYYADTAPRPGEWFGRGIATITRHGPVNPADLQRLLEGRHPATGTELVHRAPKQSRPINVDGPPLTVAQTAEALGVSERRVRKLAQETENWRTATATNTDAATKPVRPRTLLPGTRTTNGWLFERSAVAQFQAHHEPKATVIGYDITFSVPKSVSVLWAAGDDHLRTQIEAAVRDAVHAGMGYLQDRAVHVSVARRAEIAPGLLGAGYLHTTNRNHDPQLHWHVAVPNLAATRDGNIRAIDARGLYAHATTAGYLAAAHLRHELTARVGVEWGPVRSGIADIAHIPQLLLDAFSTRKAEIDTLSAELAYASPAARQVAAYRTRDPKTPQPADPTHVWQDRLARHRFVPEQVIGRTTGVTVFELRDEERMRALLLSGDGLTEHEAVFDRRRVIEHIAEHAVDRLDATQVLNAADRFLADTDVIPLDTPTLRRPGVLEQPYSTTGMLDIEAAIHASVAAGFDTGAGWVPQTLVELATSGRGLGPDQQTMVESVTRSGDRIQCVLGPAGSGKTYALAAAAKAWQLADKTVVGASVNGTAAEVLAAATGIEARTVAWWLTRLDLATTPVLTDRHVLVVDEASTISTRDLHRLITHVETAGATLRLIGDAAQHSAVNAGGAFRSLLDRYPDRAARLDTLRRQKGPDMADVRTALTDYRNGRITAAWDRLDTAGRIRTGDTPGALLDQLVHDWYTDRGRHHANRDTVKASSMMAEHHIERTALNHRARELLRADGTLTGPDITIGTQTFAIGDEIICRAPTKLRPAGGDYDSTVRNGTRGTITAITPGPAPGLVVDFENRGPITVPHDLLTRPLRHGIDGILTHSYALTTHAAQGETYDAARLLATDTATRPGVYVGLSRGEHDTIAYVTAPPRRRPGQPDDPLPTIEPDHNQRIATLAYRLQHSQPERLASDHDQHARTVARLAAQHTLPELLELAAGTGSPLLERSAQLATNRAATRLAQNLPPRLTELIGPRPDHPDDRTIWEHALRAVVLHDATHRDTPIDTLPAIHDAHINHLATTLTPTDIERLPEDSLRAEVAMRWVERAVAPLDADFMVAVSETIDPPTPEWRAATVEVETDRADASRVVRPVPSNGMSPTPRGI